MALAQADLDRLEAALASGELRVEYDGRRVEFRTVADLKAAIAYVREQLADASAAPLATDSVASFSKD